MDRSDFRLAIDPVLLRKYAASGPRLATYPPADRFVEAFGETQLSQWLDRRNIGGFSLPLSVYVNAPKTVSDFKYLEKELRVVDGHLGGERRISSLRWDGAGVAAGARAEATEAMRLISARFELDPYADISIGVAPANCEPGDIEFLASLGFNGVSAKFRGEPDARRVVEEARANGFRTVTLNLDHDAPGRTLDGLSDSLERILALQPDRIGLAGDESVPWTEAKLQGFTVAVGMLARAGYGCIGVDRFARDAGSRAIEPESDTLGFGHAALGRIGPTYYQNLQRQDDYRAALDAGRLPVQRGIELSADDLLRRSVIHSLTSNFRLSIESIEIAHLVEFKSYFAQELSDLRDLEADGLLEIQPDWIVATPCGRLLARAIGMVFDKYLRAGRRVAAGSRVL